MTLSYDYTLVHGRDGLRLVIDVYQDGVVSFALYPNGEVYTCRMNG